MLLKCHLMFMAYDTAPAILEMQWLLPSHSPFLQMHLQLLPERMKSKLQYE